MMSYFEYCLEEMENLLLSEEKYSSINFSKEWVDQFENSPGVYVLIQGSEIMYAGESGCLKKRMRDLSDTRNHSLRRTIARHYFLEEEGYEAGNSSKKMPAIFEHKLNNLFSDEFKISAITVNFGRKELEESIIEKYNPVFNSRKRRKGDDVKAYSVEKIRKTHNSAYKPWTKEDDLKLLELKNKNLSIKEICKMLGRNTGAIKSRIRKIAER